MLPTGENGEAPIDMVMPGDNSSVFFSMKQRMPLMLGLPFTVMHGKDTILSGVVSQLLPLLNNDGGDDFLRAYIENDKLFKKAK